MTVMGLKKQTDTSHKGPLFCHVKEFGLHFEGNKEDFVGFKMGAQIGLVFQEEFALALAWWEIKKKLRQQLQDCWQ